jgi:hypothetical protein
MRGKKRPGSRLFFCLHTNSCGCCPLSIGKFRRRGVLGAVFGGGLGSACRSVRQCIISSESVHDITSQ